VGTPRKESSCRHCYLKLARVGKLHHALGCHHSWLCKRHYARLSTEACQSAFELLQNSNNQQMFYMSCHRSCDQCAKCSWINPLLVGHTLLMDIGAAAGVLVVSEQCKCECFLYVCTRGSQRGVFFGSGTKRPCSCTYHEFVTSRRGDASIGHHLHLKNPTSLHSEGLCSNT